MWTTIANDSIKKDRAGIAIVRVPRSIRHREHARSQAHAWEHPISEALPPALADPHGTTTGRACNSLGFQAVPSNQLVASRELCQFSLAVVLFKGLWLYGQRPRQALACIANLFLILSCSVSFGQLSTPNSSPPTVESSVVTIDPNLLVLNAIHQSVWGPPLSCKIYQTSRAYGQQITISGEYTCAGAGSGQFRYTSRVAVGETVVDTIQVSDGRLMYTQVGANTPPKRVVIDQVRQSIGNAIHYANDHPDVSISLAIGGQPELLRSLYHRYIWYQAKGLSIEGVDVWRLVGRLRTEPPKIAGSAPVDTENMKAVSPDSRIPTDVRLTLGRTASLPYFPYCVEYYQRVKGTDGAITTEVVSKLVYSEPTPANISEKDFFYQVQADVARIEQETTLYIPAKQIAGQFLFPMK